MQDVAGRHNTDPSTRARLLKGGSWKKQRIVVVIPTGASIPAKVALSHWSLMFPPNNGVARMLSSVEHVAGTWRYVLTERERLKAVTAADVQRVAKKYFTPQNRTVGELRPKSGGGADESAGERPAAERWEGAR